MNPTVSVMRTRTPCPSVHFAGERVERGEEPVFDEDVVLAGERAQDARLAGVGVAHQRRA